MPRVSMYINFTNKTEEAFLFYKSVFGGEFTAPGIRRFGDMPAMNGMPATPPHLVNLVMHVELPILGGYILMGTDAPPEMGFSVTTGNNMHINLEPDTREETKRLFNAIADGGKVITALQEMFWGAYFGNCKDKFGINWMFNCMGK